MNRSTVLFALAGILASSGVGLAAEVASPSTAPPTPSAINSGDTTWMLVATAMVLLMTPGLALFYGGMVRRKNVLGTMMHSMVALAIIGIQWLLFGYCLAFGESQGGWIGWTADFLGLAGVSPKAPYPGTNIPIFVHCMYQGMFAIITPALISGALAERIRFGPYCLFILLWSTLVYDPLAHWVWAVEHVIESPAPAGWMGKIGALDFAGGIVVHISAGVSALAAILVLRKRIGYPEHAMHPNSMVLTLTGAGLLWFGWFGFNGGSALKANGLACAALTASQVAGAAAALSWALIEWYHKGKPTALGLASGMVAGLATVTPASGYVNPMGAMAIGLLAGGICYVAVCLKPWLRYDDSLDAFGVHGVGGFLGVVLTGVFFNAAFFQEGSGDALPKVSLFGAEAPRVVAQLVAGLAAAVYAFVVTVVLVKIIDRLWGFCVVAREEGEGLDRTQHGEVGFDLGLALESVVDSPSFEPRPATLPPNGQKRFTVVVEGPTNGDLIHTWSALCQVRDKPPAAEFKAVYPYVTTVQGNRFRFRGGDPVVMRENLQRLFQGHMTGPIRTHVEN